MTAACCICDPTLCAADDTGEHCTDRSCGSCLHGCPAPDDQCCNAPAPRPVAHDAAVALFLTLALLWAAIAGPHLLITGSL